MPESGDRGPLGSVQGGIFSQQISVRMASR
jgi:hypothetical protein